MPALRLIGRSIWNFFPAVCGTAYEVAYQRAMRERVPVSIEVEGLYDDKWYRVSVFPTQHGISIVWTDITQRRQAETSLREREQFLRSMIESSCDCIKTLDLEGNLLSMSEGGRKLLEIPDLQPYLGRPWTDLWQPDDRSRVRAAIAAASGGNTGRFQAFCPTMRGRPVWWDVMITPIRAADLSVHQLLALSRDITAQKEMEEKLRETDRRKTEFLGVLSHELRNPLAPIRNGLHILLLPDVDHAAVRQVKEMMEKQVNHLTRMVDDLLDVSRITRGRIQLRREPVDLAGAVRQALESVRPLVEAQGHRLLVSLPGEPVRIEADPTRLEQVLVNLLNNAAKYTRPGGEIALIAEREGDEAVVLVRDNGVGITAELLPKVFDLFTQADASLDRSQGGLGIGLTLVKNLVELHGGRVTARSEGPDRGSEFVVRLPAMPRVADEPEDSRSRPASAGRKVRVLVVDDSRDAARSIKILLEISGHEVRVAHDGLAAVAAYRDDRPEVILLDLGLPRMSGYDVARQLRLEQGNRPPLIVAVSGYGQEEDKRRALEAGFDCHMTKPVDPAKLVALIASATSSPQGPG